MIDTGLDIGLNTRFVTGLDTLLDTLIGTGIYSYAKIEVPPNGCRLIISKGLADSYWTLRLVANYDSRSVFLSK